MTSTFRGWIPSITGSLSFSQIGQLGNYKCDYFDYHSEERECYLHCYQTRTILIDDSVFKIRGILNAFLGKNTIFELKAAVPGRFDSQPFLRGTISCYAVRRLKFLINPKWLSQRTPKFTVKFCLHRSGNLCLLGLTDHFPSQSPDPTLPYYFIRQSYYFLKDSVHRHRHHSSSDDNFLDPQLGNAGWKKKIAYQLGCGYILTI